MRSALALAVVLLVGLFGATSIGYASYLVSRDSVGLPVTKLKLSPNLAPTTTTTKRKAAKPKPKTTSVPRTGMPSQVTTTDDRGGRSSNSGKGSDDSGHGSDDD